MSTNVNLPSISERTLPFIEEVISILNVPRNVLASDEEIMYAWSGLPRELRDIPPELRDQLLARMCIAISTGLFDGAINYIWNASINNLRRKVKNFGYNVVSQIIGKDFDEEKLYEKKDAELLKLCLELNLISEDGYYFMDQCRDLRNNYSAAHPSSALLNDREVITYINRCVRFALADTSNPRGVSVSDFIIALKGDRFSEEQLNTWITRLQETHDAQREMIFSMLHGMYCDPNMKEQSRLNALKVCESFKNSFTAETKSNFLKNHYDYQAKGIEKQYKASQIFFEKLGMLSLLNDIEIHSIIETACDNLISVHNGMDNFYNEPPFAKRLLELSSTNEVPDTAKAKFVYSVVMCRVGNPYGVSRAAVMYYDEMIKNFTPKEINMMLNIPTSNTIVKSRIYNYLKCKERYIEALNLLDLTSMQESQENMYRKIISTL